MLTPCSGVRRGNKSVLKPPGTIWGGSGWGELHQARGSPQRLSQNAGGSSEALRVPLAAGTGALVGGTQHVWCPETPHSHQHPPSSPLWGHGGTEVTSTGAAGTICPPESCRALCWSPPPMPSLQLRSETVLPIGKVNSRQGAIKSCQQFWELLGDNGPWGHAESCSRSRTGVSERSSTRGRGWGSCSPAATSVPVQEQRSHGSMRGAWREEQTSTHRRVPWGCRRSARCWDGHRESPTAPSGCRDRLGTGCIRPWSQNST